MRPLEAPRLLSFRGNVMLTIALIILILMTLVFRLDQVQYQNAEAELERIRETMDANADLMKTVIDAETGQRGYMLTGNRAYLQPYSTAVNNLNHDMQRLSQNTAGQPVVDELAATLRRFVLAKMQELKYSIELRDEKGALQALDLVRTDKGRALMTQVRDLSAKIEATEQRRLRNVYMELDRHATHSRVELSFGSVALFLLVIASAIMTARDMTDQQRLLMELGASEERYKKLAGELELRVKQRTQELEESNRNLESFSYSVSHDLRAPLRAISGFSHMLSMKTATNLDPESTNLLQRIHDAARRMGELIDDLLALSRTGRAALQRTQVSLSAMVTAIVADLHNRYPERIVDIRIAPHIEASADPRLLRTALENLLDNAWKFTGRTAVAVIEFGTTAETSGDGATPVYYVRDNGAGFNPEYSANLFAPFQRLHSPQEFEGTGIGLANVQRIIQRHGGRIWAEGRPGSGATFFFTLGE